MLRSATQDQNDTYPIAVSKRLWRSWSDAFESPISPHRLGRVRAAIGLMVAWIAVDSLFTLERWIGRQGLLGWEPFREVTEREWGGMYLRPTLLSLLDSEVALIGYCGMMGLTALLLAMGIGGRWCAAFAFVLFVGLAHRTSIVSGPADFLVSALLLYLVVDPGKLQSPWKPGLSDTESRRSATFAVNLMCMHVWMWVLFSLLSQLAAVLWWEGEGIWFLSLLPASYLDSNWLATRGYVVNLLSHGLIASQVIAIMALPSLFFRPLGITSSWIAWLIVGTATGDFDYALAGIVGTLIFWESKKEVANRTLLHLR